MYQYNNVYVFLYLNGTISVKTKDQIRTRVINSDPDGSATLTLVYNAIFLNLREGAESQ